jgi:hypothetical protein
VHLNTTSKSFFVGLAYLRGRMLPTSLLAHTYSHFLGAQEQEMNDLISKDD